VIYLRGCKFTVSPPRVPHTATPPRVVQPIVIHIAIPNLHRRLNPTPCREVTPSTPHTMIRRSDTQQHLSNDMLAETVQQENQVFSLSTGPTAIKTIIIAKTARVIIMPEMANAVICPDTGKSLKHQELITMLRYKIKWIPSTANEIHRRYKTNTIIFIRKYDVPKERKVTYGPFVVDIKEHKKKIERTRLTVGGDQIEYPGNKYTRTAGLITAKILINRIISTKGATLSTLPQEIIDEYNLLELAHEGRVYIEIQKCIYGLPQAGILTNTLLQQHLDLDGYHPTEYIHGLWKHETLSVWF
jgi:hypothetical protein